MNDDNDNEDEPTPAASPDAGGDTPPREETVEGEEEAVGDEGSEDAPDAPEEDAEGDAPPGDEEDSGEEDGAEAELPSLPIASVVEAVLFAAREPLKLANIARAVGKRTRTDAVRAAIGDLNVAYLETGRAFEIAEISGRFQLMSRPEYAPHIMRIYPKRDLADTEKNARRLTPAMLDTLAIIAYKQPVMRSDIEHIRGVACGPVLRALIERGSVREVGRRADLVGKPAVFGTTDSFLVEFGLGSLEELPLRNEFAAPGAAPQGEMVAIEPAETVEAGPAGEETSLADAGGGAEAGSASDTGSDTEE